jgi:hypothetical protein
MTTLTSEQKEAGREFRSRWLGLLKKLCQADAEDGYPVSRCSPFTVWFRHTCGERGSQALFLRQQYATDEAGLFAFTYRQAACPHCQLHVRSGGVLALASDSPPEKGAVVHAAYQLRAVHPDQGGTAPAPGLER